MNQSVTAEKVFAVPYLFHGEPQICFFYDEVPPPVRKNRLIGGMYPIVRIVELAPEFWALDLGDLLKLWDDGRLESGAASVDESEFDEVKVKEFDIAKRLETLNGIILTSNQEGEVEAAKRLFKKYTGKDWHA